MRRHWTINGRFLQQPITGVQRVARRLVIALDDVLIRRPAAAEPLLRGLEVEVLMPPGTQHLPHLRAIGQRCVGRGHGHYWEQVELARHVSGGLVSLCNSGPLITTRHIVCIHDANTRIVPQSYAWQFRLLYAALLPALGRRARTITTVSQDASKNLARFGICSREKVRVVPNGHDHVKDWRPRHSTTTRNAAGQSTIVVIGSPAPHKNLDLLLRLAPQLRRAGLRLAIVGQRDTRIFAGAERSPAAASATDDTVTWLGLISDDEIAALLGNCLCLAFPSLAEGFGLPALEAMAMGCPVVATDRSSLPEICADAVLYASPVDPEAWLASFQRLASTPALRSELADRGRARAQEFTWGAAALDYLGLMAEADGLAPSQAAALETSIAASI